MYSTEHSHSSAQETLMRVHDAVLDDVARTYFAEYPCTPSLTESACSTPRLDDAVASRVEVKSGHAEMLSGPGRLQLDVKADSWSLKNAATPCGADGRQG